jgi:hypothetical protein
MRSLKIEQIEDIIKDTNFVSSTLVETGTYEGNTVFNLYEFFNKIYTIELNKRSFDFCINKSNNLGINNIKFYNGQSQDILPNLIQNELSDLDSCIFFLDAHYTKNDYGLTSKGDVDVPVCLEVGIITQLFKKKCIIIIDDARALGKTSGKETAYADWSNITHDNITSSIKNRSFTYKYYDGEKDPNDRLVLFIDNI